MTVVRLRGGLGNQLFQLSAALFLGNEQKARVKLDTSWFAMCDREDDTPRQFEIGGCLMSGELRRVPRLLTNIVYNPARNPLLVRETGPDDDVIQRVRSSWSWVEGFFQRRSYPLAVSAELRSRVSNELCRWVDPSLVQHQIAVHVRLGDYLSNLKTRAFHGLTEPGYFTRALAMVKEEVGELPVAVFTDSPERLASYLPLALLGEVTIVDAVGAWETLSQMENSRALVMSNSSLSWWSAFVGSVLLDRPMSVVLPKPWFAEATTVDSHLPLRDWTQLPRDPETK